jgi:hypothetical protein
MSEDDQNAAIGRMMKERAEARREIALLSEDIRNKARLLQEAANYLSRGAAGVTDMATGLSLLDRLNLANGMARYRASIEECRALLERVDEITASLRNAGVES